MNKERREELDAIYSDLEEIKAKIEFVMEEEQSSFDNLPEGLQQSERGEAMTTAIDNMETALSSLDDVMTYVEEAKQ